LQFGRYQIIEKLGSGGMGVVYRAMALGVDGFQKPVVIKRIHGHLAVRPELLRRFINEAKISMGMTHGNVVQVLDLGKMGPEYFIALEYVDGRDLRDVLKRCLAINEWLPAELSLLVMTDVLRGLDYAHRRTDSAGKRLGIVHRDITPANILCSYEGEVKLTDFGIARALAWAGATQVGAIRGSVKYMSPEQAWGSKVDQRSDLFSVGAVLYLLLCRAHPFSGDRMEEILEHVREASFPPPTERKVELADELETILLTAMAKEPDDRYPSAAAMLAALESYQRTIPHATSSDLQALMQRLFEQEIQTQPEVPADQLVGAAIEMSGGNGDQAHDPYGISVYSVTGTATRPDIPSGIPSADTEVEQLVPATQPGDVADVVTERDLRAVTAPASRWLLRGLLLLVLFLIGIAAGLWLTRKPDLPTPRPAVLVVKTTPPGAEVLIDDKPMQGRSPTVMSSLRRGKAYRVTARLADHAEAQAKVTLDGPTRTVVLRLRRTVGSLMVTSIPPGASVLVDGQASGATPRELKLELRKTKIEIRHPEHEIWSREISLTKDRPTAAIDARLEPLKTEKNKKTRRTKRAPAVRSAKKRAIVGKGWVRISTRPAYAEVYLRGRRVDTTPCRIQLPAGNHRLQLVNPALELSVTRTVTVRKGQEVELSVNGFTRAGRARPDRRRERRRGRQGLSEDRTPP
jgi:serine/threonine protein kinase